MTTCARSPERTGAASAGPAAGPRLLRAAAETGRTLGCVAARELPVDLGFVSTHSLAEPLTSRATRAGVPTASMPSGMRMPGGTVLPAATSARLPINRAVEHCRAVADERLGADDRAVHHAQVADRGTLANLGDRVHAAV